MGRFLLEGVMPLVMEAKIPWFMVLQLKCQSKEGQPQSSAHQDLIQIHHFHKSTFQPNNKSLGCFSKNLKKAWVIILPCVQTRNGQCLACVVQSAKSSFAPKHWSPRNPLIFSTLKISSKTLLSCAFNNLSMFLFLPLWHENC